MTKKLICLAACLSVCLAIRPSLALSFPGAQNLAPKMIVTCEGVSGSLSMNVDEATQFVKNVKNLKADNPICLKDKAATNFCLGLINGAKKKCSAKAAM